MIELVCIEPSSPKELRHMGRYECLDSRITSEGEAQVRVLSGEAATPQVPHQLWWPLDLFEIAPSPIDTKELRKDMASIDAALAELEKSLVPKDSQSFTSKFADRP